jgi:hypothetical protein
MVQAPSGKTEATQQVCEFVSANPPGFNPFQFIPKAADFTRSNRFPKVAFQGQRGRQREQGADPQRDRFFKSGCGSRQKHASLEVQAAVRLQNGSVDDGNDRNWGKVSESWPLGAQVKTPTN